MPYRDDVNEERLSTPMVEIFGSAFILLLILLVILNTYSQIAQTLRQEETPSEGEYKISWDENTHGYVVLTFPGKIKIIEKNTFIPQDQICNSSSPFVSYALEKYSKANEQIIFSLLEGSIATMAVARNCLRKIMPNRPVTIGWIVANNEFLKSVDLDEIPPYIEKVLEKDNEEK